MRQQDGHKPDRENIIIGGMAPWSSITIFLVTGGTDETFLKTMSC